MSVPPRGLAQPVPVAVCLANAVAVTLRGTRLKCGRVFNAHIPPLSHVAMA